MAVPLENRDSQIGVEHVSQFVRFLPLDKRERLEGRPLEGNAILSWPLGLIPAQMQDAHARVVLGDAGALAASGFRENQLLADL